MTKLSVIDSLILWGIPKFRDTLESNYNKKVLLRERKKHTARRVAIAISCYCGGGGGGGEEGGRSLDKNFFPSLNMYQAKAGVKKFFPLLWGGGGPLNKNFFSQSEHVSSQIWCQKFFPLLRLGTPLPKIWDLGPPPPKNLRPGIPPWKIWDLGPPPPENLRSGTPPPPDRRLGPGTPPSPEMWTDWKYNLPSSFGWRAVKSAT